MGKRFKVETDHSALVNVFNRDRNNKDYSPRLIAWRHRMLMYDFEIVYVPGNEMRIRDYLSRSPHAREAEDKSLTEVITISFLQSLNKEKNKFLTKAVIDSFPKPFEPKARQKRKKVSETLEQQAIGKLSESMKTDAKLQPIRFVQNLSRAIKTNTC